MREEIRKIQDMMEAAEYVTDAPVATSIHLAMRLRKPLLIEGPAGVGKTEVAKVMARMLSTNLIRLQCYEGLDASTALYEWNYQKQLLRIQADQAERRSWEEVSSDIFSADFLLERSPITYVDNVRAPLLVMQGANDPRVVKPESDQMVERLRELGREVEYVVFEDEGHGFTKRSNQLRGFRLAADWLEQHLSR